METTEAPDDEHSLPQAEGEGEEGRPPERRGYRRFLMVIDSGINKAGLLAAARA